VRVGVNTSATLTINTGTPHRYVLIPLLYSHNCVAMHDSNTIIKFAGLITDDDAAAYREHCAKMVQIRGYLNMTHF
jgi:hypothetical protein